MCCKRTLTEQCKFLDLGMELARKLDKVIFLFQHFLHPVNIQDVEGNHFTMLKKVKVSDFEDTSPFTS